MKKSKIVFAIIAVLVAILCLVTLIPGKQSSISSSLPPATTSTAPTDSTAPTTPAEGSSESSPIMPTASEETYPSYTLADNVRITQVEKDPNEVIHAFQPIEKNDPEYFFSGTSTYETMEGKVFRNDKTISIDVYDEFLKETRTFTFGYITGQCNRFLYLNPVCEQAAKHNQFGFRFCTMQSGGGSIATIPGNYTSTDAQKKAFRDAPNFTVERTLDQREIPSYVDPKHPGTVWFTQTPIQGDLWIDVMVYQMGGDFVATLRLTIAKGDDGTYSIVNLQNKNLLQNSIREDVAFSRSELEYIYGLADSIINDPDAIKFANNSLQKEMPIERYLMEYRDRSTSLYFQHFVPAGDGYCASSSDYLYNPTIAVTARQHCGMATCVTMYFHVIKPATDTEHGIYEYIGRDYLFYTDKQALINQGCPEF